MTQRTRTKPPAYGHFKPRNVGVVRIDGKDFYLGEYDSPESWELYHRLLAERYFSKTVATDAPATDATGPHLKVKELCLRFMEHAKAYYQKDGRPTSELEGIRQALMRLIRLYSELLVVEFSPTKLKLVREEFVRDGNCRTVTNHNISRIRRMFRWGVEQELVPVAIFQALMAVTGLKKGRCAAREAEPILPVTAAVINATLPHLAPTLQAMVRIQLLSGCRPGELCGLRPSVLSRLSEILESSFFHTRCDDYGEYPWNERLLSLVRELRQGVLGGQQLPA